MADLRNSLKTFALSLVLTLCASQALAGFTLGLNQCIVGNPSVRFIEDKLMSSQGTTDDPVLRQFGITHLPAVPACSCTSLTYEFHSAASTFFSLPSALIHYAESEVSSMAAVPKMPNPQKLIDPACIDVAIKRLPNLATPKANCSSEHGFPTASRDTPCLTEHYVQFMAFAANETIKCLTSAPLPLDPQLLFNQLNDESAFGSFLTYVGGTGTTQMTSIATAEMTTGPGGQYLQNLVSQKNQSPSCAMLQGVISRTQPSMNRICGNTATGSGVMRNIMQGIGLFLYYRDGRTNSLRTRLAKLSGDPNFEKLLDQLSLVAFSRFGPAGSDHLAQAYIERVKRNPSYTADQFIADLHGPNGNAYIKEIDSKIPTTLTGSPRNCAMDQP